MNVIPCLIKDDDDDDDDGFCLHIRIGNNLFFNGR